jgi:iron complex outermembrane receptor protein
MAYGVSGLALAFACMATSAGAQAEKGAAMQAAVAALPEVVVTARRRAEDLQSTPVAASVVDRSLIEQSYSINTQQFAQLAPSLNYSSANPRNTAFTIRGLGSSVVAVSQANDGLEPGVGFYVDQVYHARPATAAFDLPDLDQVEVLRGPQGTLFGKNTTAGAINIASRAPTFTPEAQAELSYGGFAFIQGRAAVSGPLVGGKLAGRISGVITRRDGVIDNVVSGIKHNEIRNEAVRAQLLFTPNAALKVRLIGDWTRFDSNCCTQVHLRVGTSLRAAARQYPALAAGLGYTPASLDAYDRKTDIDAALRVKTSEGGIAAIADYDVGPATLTSVTAWRFWNWNAANDRDYTGIPIQMIQGIPSRQDQYSQELRLASNGERKVGYVAGLYYFRQRITGRPVSIYGPQATYWLLGPAPQFPANLLDGYGQDGHTRFVTDSYAAFAEVNWKIAARLTVTGGLRYTSEHKEGDYSTFVFGGLQTANATLVNAKLSILRPQAYSAKDNDGSLSGRGNLSYRIAGGVLGYVSYARGFKSGGVNMSGLALNAQNQPALSTAVVRPERNTTYEAGLKSSLLGRRATVNLAGYYTEVKDFQATVVDSSQTAALRGYLSNIPEVTVKGFEADAAALVAEGLTLRASLTYAHGEYTDYPAGPCPLERQTASTAACNLTGLRLSGLPRWAATLGADYERPAHLGGRRGAVYLHADSSFRSGYFGDPSLSQYTWIQGYNVTNASLGYRDDAGWEVAVFARNLFNADYIQNLTIQAGNSGLILGTPSDPRLVGATLRIRR